MRQAIHPRSSDPDTRGGKPPRGIPDEVFEPAPMGSRVRLITWTCLALVFVAITLTASFAPKTGSDSLLGLIVATVVVFPLLALSWFAGRIRRYRLSDDALTTEFLWRKHCDPLADLTRIDLQPGAMKRAWKIVGNGGLGVVSGRFRNKKLGYFRAYVSDGDKTVVLRWPDHVVVVSPERSHAFVQSVRKRLGLRTER